MNHALIYPAAHHILLVKNKIFMKKIILIGAGGHCKSCIDVIENENKYKIIGVIDKKKKRRILNYKVFSESYLNKTLIKKIMHLLQLDKLKITKLELNCFIN